MSLNRLPNRYRRLLILALYAASTAFTDNIALASDDHDRARQALEAGEVLPLRTILEQVEREIPGQIIDVELERDHDFWFYKVKVLRSGGSLVKLKVDARNGKVVGKKLKNGNEQQPWGHGEKN
jgi:uncharacterized membrane protein YkoI